MKKALYIIVGLVLLSCEKDDNHSNPDPYLTSLDGRYELVQCFTETPVDLNFDGIERTDMFVEIDCFKFFTLPMFKTIIDYNTLFEDTTSLMVEVPRSYVDSDVEPFSQCFDNGQIYYENVEINKETGDITILMKNEEQEAQIGKLVSGQVDGDMLYFELDVPLFTSEGWQTVRMYEVYKKYQY